MRINNKDDRTEIGLVLTQYWHLEELHLSSLTTGVASW